MRKLNLQLKKLKARGVPQIHQMHVFPFQKIFLQDKMRTKAKLLQSLSSYEFQILSYCFHVIYYCFIRGVLLPGAPKPRYLINKLIKQQEQIYHLQL